jgi:hypothetical protein
MLPSSAYPELRRLIYFFADDTTHEQFVVEFPPDDMGLPMLLTLAESPTKFSRRVLMVKSPKIERKLTRASEDSRFSLLERQTLSIAGDRNSVPTLVYRVASGFADRTAIQAHPIILPDSDRWWKPGKGAVCSVASGASLGCAFVSRVRFWDGSLFNDPLATRSFGPAPFGTALKTDSTPVLVDMMKYFEDNKEQIESSIARFVKGEPQPSPWRAHG